MHMDTIDNYAEKYRWEWHQGNLSGLNEVFKNDVPPEKRTSILSKLEITNEQKEFLLNTYDIDWLAVVDRKPNLIEDKSASLKRLKGRSLLLSCGYLSQPQTLQKATELGIRAGVFLKVVIWGTLGTDPNAVFARGFGANDDTRELFSKFYLWGESAIPSPSGKQIKLIDDFNGLASRLQSSLEKNE